MAERSCSSRRIDGSRVQARPRSSASSRTALNRMGCGLISRNVSRPTSSSPRTAAEKRTGEQRFSTQ